MTLLEDPRVEASPAELKLGEAGGITQAAVVADAAAPEGAPVEEAGASDLSPWLASAAAFLATAAAGWMAGGVFSGVFPRVIGVVAALLGAGMVALSHKTKMPFVVQLLVLPLAVVFGAILVAPDATGGTANLPSLIVEALKSGGLSAPPVPFDPGWRFLLVVLVSAVAVTGASAALATGRAHLAVFIPVPMTVAAVLVQPPASELTSVLVALVATVGALAVAYGADLAKQGTTGGEFEVRRLGKAAGIMAALVVALTVLSQFGAVIPEQQDHDIVPPTRPQVPPPAKDRVIFTVKSDLNLPWRLGVLDVYDKTAWLNPPYDPARFVDVAKDGRVPGVKQPPPESRVSVTFDMVDIEGRLMPNIAEPRAIKGGPGSVEYDPRTQQFRAAGRLRHGTSYTVEALAPPTVDQLVGAAAPPPEIQREFLKVPPAPQAVRELIDQIPPDVPAYERMQFVRTKFYESVIAAGAGKPVDVPPARVAQLLGGAEASPYEITAAEVLLVRWAGVPARIGYGYYGGEKNKDGVVEIRPKHGAMWLEAYFEGPGWVPIVGRPPRAKSSLSTELKNDDPLVRPTEELAAVVYVPLRLQRITLLNIIIQYWLGKILPVLAAMGFVATFYVGLLKTLRRFRRHRWAAGAGPRERIAVAYSQWRDYAIDLNIGHPTLTPIEFLDAVVPDEDHIQLAWVVTRTMWGDLARDCRSEDAAQCEQWAHSLRKRLAAAQSPFMRVLAFASRASLRDPYTREVPNLWWPWSPRQRLMAAVRSQAGRLVAVLKRFRRARLRWAARRAAPRAAALWVLLLGCAALVLGGCVQDVDLKTRPAAKDVAPLPSVPPELSGYRFEPDESGAKAFEFYYDDSLAAAGQLYAVRDASNVVQATLQTTVLKPALKGRVQTVRKGVLRAIGGGQFRLGLIGGEPVYAMRLPEQRMLLAFGKDGQTYQLLVATNGFEGADQLFIDLLAKQQGKEAVSLATAGGAPPPDPRRGTP